MTPRTAALVVALLSSSVLACSGAGTEQAPAASAAAVSKSPVGVATHGPVHLVGEALGDVALRPEQRAKLEALATEADARHAPLAARRKELLTVVADQLERGSLDRAALQAKIDAAKPELEAVRRADAASIAQMHAILDRDQRSALVDALESRWKARRHRGAAPGDLGLAPGGMRELAAQLELTSEQKRAIKDAFRDARHHDDGDGPRAMRGRMRQAKQALESFREDTFVPPGELPADGALGPMTSRMLDLAEKAVAVLTPAQRTLLAGRLRAAAAR